MTYLANEPTHFLNCTKQLRAWVKGVNERSPSPRGKRAREELQDMVSDFEL